MAAHAAYICRLDAQTGRLPHSDRPGFIYRVASGSTVQFQLDSASPLNGRSTTLIIDLAKYEGSSEDVQLRGTRTKLKHWVVDVEFNGAAGSYRLSLEYVDKASGELRRTVPDYILVDPILVLNGQPTLLDSVLTRSLGPYTRWEEVLTRQRELGYQLFHMTPIQELGTSQSLYSLGDQLKLNSSLFPGLHTDEEQMSALENTLVSLERRGIGCLIDIVLNHMSVNSEFTEENPEATYNLDNSPHLRAAYELDHALETFSTDLANDRVPNYRHGHTIDCERDLTNIMQIVKLELLPKLKLQEYFQMDQKQVLKQFHEAKDSPVPDAPQEWVEFVRTKGLEAFIKHYALLGEGEGRQAVTVSSM